MLQSGFLAALSFGAVAVAAGPMIGTRSSEARSRWALAAALFLPVATVALFTSLAFHMHGRLGGWPATIGDAGFPPGLVLHADVAMMAFGSLLLGGLFGSPVALLLCATVPALRPGLKYVGAFAIACVVAFGVMQLAPEPFLDWWWD